MSTELKNLIFALVALASFMNIVIYMGRFTMIPRMPTYSCAPCSQVGDMSSLEIAIPSIKGFSKRPSLVSKGHICTPEQLKKQSELARHLSRTHTWHIWSGCSKTDFLQLYAQEVASLASKENPMVLINIGANKGYSIVDKYAYWVQESGVNPRSLHKFIQKAFPSLKRSCDTCGECNFKGPESLDIKRENLDKLKVFAVEPSPGNIELLDKVKEWLNTDFFTVIQAAGLNEAGTVQFPNTTMGDTLGYLEKPSQSSVTVPTITVQDLAKENNLDTIDMLFIDTEGFDPLVLEGSKSLIAKQKIKIIIFEYHSVNYWAKNNPQSYSLEETSDFFDFFGYDCYIEGTNEMLRLTGCWINLFEFRTWSNILCVLRSEIVANEIAMSISKHLST